MDHKEYPEGSIEALEQLLNQDGFQAAPEPILSTETISSVDNSQEAQPEAGDAVQKEIPAEESPIEETPMEEVPVEEAPVEEVPVEEIPAEEIPVEEVPTEEAPVEEVPAEEIPAEEPAAPDEELASISHMLGMDAESPKEETPAEEEPQQEYRDAVDNAEFDEMFGAEEAPEKKAPPRKRPPRKGRPKRKKGEGFFGIPNILVTLVWLAITVVIGVTLGRMIWVCAADVLAFGRDDKPVTVTIYESDTIDDIARKLHKGELIRYPELFKFYASLAVDEGEIHPGIWDLNTRYDYHALVSMMSPSSSRDVVKVMIPEGYTCQQIFDLLQEEKIATSRDLADYASNGDLGDYWFLEGIERGNDFCLEGFLFPDTYQFYKNESPENVFHKLLDNFDKRFTEEMQGQIDALNAHLTDLMHKGGKSQDFIDSHQFDIYDVVIVASLIEKETSSAEEGHTIASVIYNRLFNWGDTPAYLNIDATIVYALGGKTNLTLDDLKVGSPYNTYTNTGLTPGPIANPGLASLKAALEPADTNYYYYVLDPATGSHRFTKTLDEHEAAIASIGGQE